MLREEVKNPAISSLTTITDVDVSPDLQNAKVFVSVIDEEANKKVTLDALKSAAGYIAVHASKKVVLRTFPSLTFKLDDSFDRYSKIEEILQSIQEEEVEENE